MNELIFRHFLFAPLFAEEEEEANDNEARRLAHTDAAWPFMCRCEQSISTIELERV